MDAACQKIEQAVLGLLGLADLMDRGQTTDRNAAAIRMLALNIDEQLSLVEMNVKEGRYRPGAGGAGEDDL